MADLHTGYDSVIWVTSAYLLAFAAPLLVAGRSVTSSARGICI
jgi:hypothetical protein